MSKWSIKFEISIPMESETALDALEKAEALIINSETQKYIVSVWVCTLK